MRQLIVNADDFGLSPGVSTGIIEAHEHGIVSSASLMVLQEGAEAAAHYARATPSLGVGLHIDVAEWRFDDGQWIALYERVDGSDAVAVETEVERQLARFQELVGSDPDHLDSHQHVHRQDPLLGVLQRLSHRLGVPLRRDGAVHFCGAFYGQSDQGDPLHQLLSVERLLALLDELAPGCTELACHPGRVAADDPLGGTMYRSERNIELRTLCDPRVRRHLAHRDIALRRFADGPLPRLQAAG